MNFERIALLVRLRYKLMWARTRTRNGKIALFFAGYLLLIMFLVLVAAGGLGAGVAAVKSGKATMVAAAVLGGLFLQALLAAVILGFGINEVFADIELRRFPLRAREREVARHFLGAVDPFWLLILTLDLGLLAGLYLFGAGSFWLGLLAVLLLFVCNYVLARVLSMLVERTVRKKGGSTVLLAMIMGLAFLPGLIAPGLKKGGPAPAWVHTLLYTPPAGAAMAMTHTDASAASGLGLVVVWTGLLIAALVALERRPAQTRSAKRKLTWDNGFERVGGLFGAEYAVLVGQWLRFYARNNRFRMIYPLALPLMAGLVALYVKQGAFGKDAGKLFVGALGGFTCIGFIGTAQFAVNQFGYVGSGFRRYMLLPTNPAATLRAGSYAFLLLSSMLIPMAALLWLIFSPMRTDPRMLVMLVSCAVVGLFLMHAVALWVAVLAPRRGNYYASFGNDLSLMANVAVIGGLFLLLFLPRLATLVWPGAVAPGHWWGPVALAALAFVVYRQSLRAAEAVFRVRREHLLAVMEGRK